MKALYNFFEENIPQGDTLILTVKKQPNGDFKFRISSVTGDKIFFILTKVGLSPLDNRGILGADDL